MLMNTQYSIFLVFLGLLFAVACIKPDEYSIVPEIMEIRLDKAEVDNYIEPLVISIDFQDGDGDIGINKDAPQKNIFIVDNRTGFIDSLAVPYDLESPGNIKGISGTIDVTILSSCCVPETGLPCTPNADYPPRQELVYDIYITDRSGNQSNIMKTPPLSVICPN